MIFQREIEKELHIEIDMQRLFFRGKQLENGYKLYDYNINLNDVIQLMIKIKIDNTQNKATSSNDSDIKKKRKISENKEEELVEAESLYYKVGDAIDCLDQIHGAWFEAIIQKILQKEEEIIYNVLWEFDDKAFPFNVPETCIRPRVRHLIPFDELSVGQKVMINYNVDEPKQVGLWYDFTISKIEKKRKLQELTGMLHMGRYIFFLLFFALYYLLRIMIEFNYILFIFLFISDHQLEIQKVNPKGEIYAIEAIKLLTERTAEDERFMISNGKRRRIAATCTTCMDNPRKKCQECGCKVCAGKQDEHNLLLCDECNYAYHLGCLNPPLATIPDDDYWYCPECKNDENEIVKVCLNLIIDNISLLSFSSLLLFIYSGRR